MKNRIIHYIPLCIIVILVFVLLLKILSLGGALFTHDSVAYSYGAKSFLEGNGLVYFGYKTPIIQWPPLYVLLLIIPVGLGLELSKFILIMNCLIFLVIIFVSGKWLLDNLKSKWLLYIGMLFILFSIPMIHISTYIWTEPLFILLFLLAIISLQKYLNGESLKWLIIAAILSALCWLTRYTGIVLLFTNCVILIIKQKPIKLKVKRILIYSIISGLPMTLWVLRNIFLSQTFTGGRFTQLTPIMVNVKRTLHIFYSWFSALDFKLGLIGILLLVVIILMSIILVCIQKKVKNMISELDYAWMTFLVFIIAYSVVIIYSASKVAMDPLNNRLWSPIYIPSIFVVFFVIDRVIYQLKSHNKIITNGVQIGILLALILIISYPIKYYLFDWDTFNLSKEGIANSDIIKNSETLWYLQVNDFPEDTMIFSNNPTIITYCTDIDSRWTPKKKGIALYNYNSFEESIINSEHLYIVWFGNKNCPGLYTINDISKNYEVQLVKQLDDGIIYKIIK